MGFEAAMGTRIGEYSLSERIGSGGFAEVWKAHHHVLNKTVAIKIPLSQTTELFRNEIRTLDSLDHPNIVQVIAASVTHDPPYLVMEYISGGTLRDQLKTKEKLSPREVRKICHELLSALELAHERGIVHGDLKPENILVTSLKQLRIADFGLSRSSHEARQSIQLSGSIGQSRAISGTLDYMPREVRDGQKPDKRADIYAFGVLLFELLTGRRPDVDEKPGDLVNNCPKLFDELFERCYTRYEKRFKDATEALKYLEKKELGREPKEQAGQIKLMSNGTFEKTPDAEMVLDHSEDEEGVWQRCWMWFLIIGGFFAFAILARSFGPAPAALLAVIYFGTLTFKSCFGD
jgi:serine/threonine protein kinase